jgi:hypothetical protein
MIHFLGAPCEVPRAGQLSDVHGELGAGVPHGPTSPRRALHPEQAASISQVRRCAKPVPKQNLYSASNWDSPVYNMRVTLKCAPLPSFLHSMIE